MTDIFMIKNGDFLTCSGITEIKQHITAALNTFYRDWVLDKTKGIDYPLGLRHTELLEHDIKKQILGVHGVRELKEFSMHQENQCIKVQADVVTDYGKTGILTTLNK